MSATNFPTRSRAKAGTRPSAPMNSSSPMIENLPAINATHGRNTWPNSGYHRSSDVPHCNVAPVWPFLAPLLWLILIAPLNVAGESPGTNSGESGTVAVSAAQACGACHSRVYDEWIESWMAHNQPWTLWSHVWDPPATGRYKMRTRIDDRTIPTLRLDQGWYDRVVEISQV